MTRNGASRPPHKSPRQAGARPAGRPASGPTRQHKRFKTQSLKIDNPVVGQVVNVGQGGLAIESLDSLSVGQTYIFKVRLGERYMRLAGRIQWCRLTATRPDGENEAKPIYKSGVALIDTVTGKAWQEALRRMTEEPAYVIWHRARGRTCDTALTEAQGPEGLQQAEPAS